MPKTVGVAVSNATFHFDKLYTYAVMPDQQEAVRLGSMVLVPFGRGSKARMGVVLACDEEPEHAKLKYLFDVAPASACLTPELLRLVHFLKERTFCTYYEAVKAVIPYGAQYKPALAADGVTPVLQKQLTRHTENSYKLVGALQQKPRPTAKQLAAVALLSGGERTQNEMEAHGITKAVLDNLCAKGVVECSKVNKSIDLYSSIPLKNEPITLTAEQQAAYDALLPGLEDTAPHSALLYGVTGSGKTFTMANVIAQCNRPTLVLAHNKTLAAQLCTEFRSFFPDNAVEYFVSYYDYYQPEAYIPSTDTYIEKDSAINDEIDRLRHSATAALSERRDVIIVASVSCIYSLGDPIDYRSMVISLRPGMQMERDELCEKLVTLQYERNDVNFIRNKFRVHGDIVDIYLAYMSELAIRVEFFGDEIDRITEFNPLTGAKQNVVKHVAIFPASHYIVSADKKAAAIEKIRAECDAQVKQFTSEGKLIEAQRIQQRTNYDIEMLTEVGICKGIENYSAVLSGRAPGSMPTTLLDYFPDDFLLFVDESHVTLPQVRAMYGGDYARKKTLVEYGFRLPSAFDNRPLKFEEVESKLNQMIFVSATPGEYERKNSTQVAQQVIRPTGLLDPLISVRPVEGQVTDLLGEINARIERHERVLVTTLTKKMAEDLTDYFTEQGIKVKYMHHEVDTFERMEIIKDLRLGTIDVVVGINLLREGLDLPEVSLVAILDADKEGFLRSETSLIQTIGRAARNAEGLVIMYADEVTDSMDRAITETERRRAIQMAYNAEHGIVPKTIVKAIPDSIEISDKAENARMNTRRMGKLEREAAIDRLTREMKEAAKLLEFEHAAFLRDQIDRLRRGENPTVDSSAETERKQNHAQTQRRGRKYLGKR